MTPADLATSRSCCSNGSNTRRVVDEFFAANQITPQIVTETENVEIIKALVRAGLGLSIVSYQSVAREVARASSSAPGSPARRSSVRPGGSIRK